MFWGPGIVRKGFPMSIVQEENSQSQDDKMMIMIMMMTTKSKELEIKSIREWDIHDILCMYTRKSSIQSWASKVEISLNFTVYYLWHEWNWKSSRKEGWLIWIDLNNHPSFSRLFVGKRNGRYTFLWLKFILNVLRAEQLSFIFSCI